MAEVKPYTRFWPLAVAAIGVAGLVYAGWRWLDVSEAPVDIDEQSEEPVADVGPDEHTEKVRQFLLPETTAYRGKVEVGSPIVVRAPQGMRVPVVKIHHEPGDSVKKGDVLVSFHRKQIDEAIEKATKEGRTADADRFRSYLEFADLKSPVDGVVVSIDRDLGEVPVDMGIGVVTLADKSSFGFVVQVPGAVQRSAMPLGAQFDVELEGDLGIVKGTVVEFRGPVGDDVPVVLRLEPHEGIEAPLNGAVKVVSGHREVGLVPKRAVSRRGDVSVVRVFDPESKSYGERTLRLGDEQGDDVVVLAGVVEGETIVVPGRK